MSTKEEILFNEYENLVHYCYRRLHQNDFILKSREDLLQEGFLAMWKGLNTFDSSYNIQLNTYLYTCIQNAMLVWIRENQSYYYYNCSFETITEEEPYNLKDMGYEEIDTIAITVSDIMNKYQHWLYKSRSTVSQKYLDMRLFRTNIILNEILSNNKVTTRYIEEKYNINRQTVSNIFKELRTCLTA